MNAGAERARARMVARQLRRRGISDERVLDAMGRVPREAVRARSRSRGTRTTTPRSHRRGTDDLAAVHRRGDVRAPRRSTAPSTCSTSARGRAMRPQCSTSWRPTWSRSSRCRRSPRARARHSTPPVTRGWRSGSVTGRLGAPDRSPFAAVAVAAATPVVPPALLEQLAVGGRLVAPLGGQGGQRLVRLAKTPEGVVETSSTRLPVRAARAGVAPARRRGPLRSRDADGRTDCDHGNACGSTPGRCGAPQARELGAARRSSASSALAGTS